AHRTSLMRRSDRAANQSPSVFGGARISSGNLPRPGQYWKRPGARRALRLGSLPMLEPGFGVFVVRQAIEEVLQVIRAAVAEVQVVAVLPDVGAEQHLAFAGRQRVRSVRGLRHLQLAVRTQHQPCPAGAELADARRLE